MVAVVGGAVDEEPARCEMVVERHRSGLSLVVGERRGWLDPVLLRNQSVEVGQVAEGNRQRLYGPDDLPVDLAVDQAHLDGDVLTVAFSDGHVAALPMAAVVRALDWGDDPEAPPAARPWVGAPPAFPEVAWGDLVIDGDPLATGTVDAEVEVAGALFRDGFVVVTGAPIAPGSVRTVAERFGSVIGHTFGTVFDVMVDRDPVDQAYTSVPLGAHTDQPYRRPPPGIQLLACLRQEAPGGDSTLVDGLAAWTAMAAAEPDLWRSLHDVDVEFRYDTGTEIAVGRAPIFDADRRGRFRSVRFSPRVDTPVGSGPEVERWYRARRWLARWFDDPANRLSFRLRPGDVLCVDNHRVLHGRTAFDDGSGVRHLQGCYIEHDGPDSLYRRARRAQLTR